MQLVVCFEIHVESNGRRLAAECDFHLVLFFFLFLFLLYPTGPISRLSSSLPLPPNEVCGGGGLTAGEIKTRTDFVQRTAALTLKIKRSSKNRRILLIRETINMQRKMNGSMGENIMFFTKKTLDPTAKKNLVWKRWIPPQREIRSKSPGSHPEGNLG